MIKNGNTENRDSLAVTAKVYGGANNSYTLRVTGIADTTISRINYCMHLFITRFIGKNINLVN